MIRSVTRRKQLFCLGIGLAAVLSLHTIAESADKVVLVIGEPYDEVRRQSRSTLPSAEPGANWFGVLTRPAKLQFADPRYGFITPPAKFFVVGYDRRGVVESVTLSPQVDVLPLDEAMLILLDLQHQFSAGGWRPFQSPGMRPIADTAATRAAIRNCDAPTTYWKADAKYQVTLNIRCFRTEARPDRERFLITLDLGGPVFDDPASNGRH